MKKLIVLLSFVAFVGFFATPVSATITTNNSEISVVDEEPKGDDTEKKKDDKCEADKKECDKAKEDKSDCEKPRDKKKEKE